MTKRCLNNSLRRMKESWVILCGRTFQNSKCTGHRPGKFEEQQRNWHDWSQVSKGKSGRRWGHRRNTVWFEHRVITLRKSVFPEWDGSHGKPWGTWLFHLKTLAIRFSGIHFLQDTLVPFYCWVILHRMDISLCLLIDTLFISSLGQLPIKLL